MSMGALLLIKRAILQLIRNPSAPVSGLGMSLFFLIVYNEGIGGIGFLPEFGQAGYLAFLFPLTIASLAMGSSSAAASSLQRDLQSGYFRRIYLSPLRRYAFVLAPLVADGVGTLSMTSVLVLVGALMGIPFQMGFLSVLGILLLSFLWGTTISALAAGVMIRSKNHQGGQMVTMLVFPLLFFSTTFTPKELIGSEWFLRIAQFNPVTYLFEGSRFLLAGTASAEYFYLACLILVISASAATGFALMGSKRILA